jgi:hypothetical protein
MLIINILYIYFIIFGVRGGGFESGGRTPKLFILASNLPILRMLMITKLREKGP